MSKRFKYQDYEAVWRYSQASGNDLLLLLALVKFRGKDGMHPSRETLATLMRCNTDTVDRCLKRLKASGELVWDKGSDHSKKANRYLILLPELDFDPRNSTRNSQNMTPDSQGKLPPNITPLNSNETEMKYRDEIEFDFSPGSDCFIMSVQLRDDLTVQQILDAKNRFMSHPSYLTASGVQVMSRWISWLTNEKNDILAPSGTEREM